MKVTYEARWQEAMAHYRPAATDDDWREMEQLLSSAPGRPNWRMAGWGVLAVLLLGIAWWMYATPTQPLSAFPIAESTGARPVTVAAPLPVPPGAPLPIFQPRLADIADRLVQMPPLPPEQVDPVIQRTVFAVPPLAPAPRRAPVSLLPVSRLADRLPSIKAATKRRPTRADSYYPPATIRQ